MKKRFLLAVLLIFSTSLMTPASATVPEGPYYYCATGGTVNECARAGGDRV